MTTNIKTKPPVWFWIISIVGLLWNLIGVNEYISAAYARDEMMATYSEAQRAIFDGQPIWLTAAFALAVFGGTLGCIALFLRKKWATPLFWISLVAVSARTGYYFFMTNTTEVFDLLQGTILPIAVIVIAGLLLIYSKISKDRNWIS